MRPPTAATLVALALVSVDAWTSQPAALSRRGRSVATAGRRSAPAVPPSWPSATSRSAAGVAKRGPTQLQAADSKFCEGGGLPYNVRAGGLMTFWAAFAFYAFKASPGVGSEIAAAADADMIKALISNPADPSIEPIFAAVFNSLGLIPVMNLALLFPGFKDQRLPGLPFALSSFAIGFFGVGPYIALREPRVDVTAADVEGFAGSVFESKIFAAGCVASALGLYGLAGTALLGPDAAEHLAAYGQLFGSGQLVHVSTLDLAVLSVLMWGIIGEDARRRDWFSPAKMVPFVALPVLGPALYLLARPGLPGSEE